MIEKIILIKALKLEQCFKDFNGEKTSLKNEAFKKFEAVWGNMLANHFLSKYADAESLIWALDNDNVELFIDKF